MREKVAPLSSWSWAGVGQRFGRRVSKKPHTLRLSASAHESIHRLVQPFKQSSKHTTYWPHTRDLAIAVSQWPGEDLWVFATPRVRWCQSHIVTHSTLASVLAVRWRCWDDFRTLGLDGLWCGHAPTVTWRVAGVVVYMILSWHSWGPLGFFWWFPGLGLRPGSFPGFLGSPFALLGGVLSKRRQEASKMIPRDLKWSKMFSFIIILKACCFSSKYFKETSSKSSKNNTFWQQRR